MKTKSLLVLLVVALAASAVPASAAPNPNAQPVRIVIIDRDYPPQPPPRFATFGALIAWLRTLAR